MYRRNCRVPRKGEKYEDGIKSGVRNGGEMEEERHQRPAKEVVQLKWMAETDSGRREKGWRGDIWR